VFLLTDGQPNIVPPRGHIPMLQRYRDSNKQLTCTINTFGFGYNLDSKLLDELAVEGDGTYSFIPDSSFTGTVFVNALSNLLTTIATNTYLSVEPTNGAKLYDGKVLGGYSTQNASWGVSIQLGSVYFGQTKDIIIHLKDVPDYNVPYLIATLSYEDPVTKTVKIIEEGTSRDGGLDVVRQTFRLKLVDSVRQCMNLASTNKNNQAITNVNNLIAEMNASEVSDDPFVQDLIKDLEGQITEALSRSDYYTKWGKHYLPSLLRAHLLQCCNNFKDPGVQHYGGDLFKATRDRVDDTFMKLPPPKPSKTRPPPPTNTHSSTRSTTTSSSISSYSYQPVNMSAYNSYSNVCFEGHCLVKMANNTVKQCKDIKKDDLVMSSNGTLSKVICVIKSICKGNKADLVELQGGLIVTPWHPVRIGNVWKFPADIGVTKQRECPAVYNFVLESGHVMIINDTECVTLGHGLKEPVVDHEYFGTERVVSDLRKFDSWSYGIIELTPESIVRDQKTHHICGIKKNNRIEVN